MKTFLIRGVAQWVRILGAPPPGYDNGPAEWSFDLILDEKSKKEYLASGGDPFYVKVDKETGNEQIKFVRKAIKKDGTKSQPIRVAGPDGAEWPQDTLIGNGSIINVRYSLNEVNSKGTKRMKPSAMAVQVWEHKKYMKNEFPVKEGSVTPAAAEDNWDDEAA